jgi:hypothetical protein
MPVDFEGFPVAAKDVVSQRKARTATDAARESAVLVFQGWYV